MADFDQFLPLLLQSEGGFVDHPADPGGATNKGITMSTFSDVAEVVLRVPATLENLKLLTDQQASVLYKHLYWDKLCADCIESQTLANLLVDFYVNAGSNAIKVLQFALNDMGVQPLVTADGLMGPATLRSLRNADTRDVYARLRKGREDYYRDLASKQPQLQCFLQGWLHRVGTFPERHPDV